MSLSYQLARSAFEDRPRRERTRSTGDAATRMRAAAPEVEPRDRGRVARQRGGRAHEEELIERVLAVMDVTAREPIARLDVGGAQHLAPEDPIPRAGRGAFEHLDDRIPEPRPRLVGPAAREVVRCTVREDRH